MNKFGIHLPNGPLANDKVFSSGFSHYTLLHLQASEFALRARQAAPDGIILIRFWLPRWSQRDPILWARECAHEYLKEREYNKERFSLAGIGAHVTPANEQNLSHEGGGDSREWYEWINSWLLAWLIEFQALTSCPIELIHFPAFAYGHSDDLPDKGYRGMEICRPAIEAYGVLDVHPYWLAPEQVTDQFFGHRFLLARELFPDKPIFCSEMGNFDVMRYSAPEEIIRWFESIYDFPYVLGGTAFMWEDPTHAHTPNDWSRNLQIAERVAAQPKREVTAFEPTPAPEPGEAKNIPNDIPQGEAKLPENLRANILKNIWHRAGVEVNEEDGFFKKALELVEQGIYTTPLPSPDGNFTIDVSEYRIAYLNIPLFCKIGDWGNVQVGLPDFQ